MTVRSRTSAGAFLALALLAGLLALLPQPAAAATIPSISEIHYDDGGADADEGVEVVADPGASLEGYRLVPVNGSGGVTYTPTVTMTGTMPASGAKWFPILGLQNGSPDGIALFSPTNALVEFLSYEGTIVGAGSGANAALNGVTSTDIGKAEAGTEADGLSLQKVDGTWIGPRASSHDVVNLPDEPEEPEEPAVCTGTGFTHTIAEVQGTGAATTVPGPVKVPGIVTGTYLTGGLNGMTIQTAGTGGPGRTVAAGTASDGIFVYFGSSSATFPDVAIGDAVEVTGTAAEFNAVTQITTASANGTAVCSEGNALPAATPLALPLAADAKESAENMLVAPSGTYTISDTFQSDRFGELILAAGSEPAPVPTDLYAPGTPEALAQKATNANGRVLLDDGRSTNLTSTGELPSYYGPTTGIRAGDQVAAFGPVTLTFGFDEWRLQPTTPVTNATPAASRTTFASTNPRPPAPADVLGATGDLKVGSFNVLNYFVDFGGDARGAANPAALAKQQAKIVSAIIGLDADVLALEEIENSIKFTPAEPQKALATLVAALNQAEGGPTWAYVGRPSELPGAASEDVITTAIIYKPAAVAPVGAPRSINDETVWFNAREPIAQTFSSGDAVFTVVANHLKSKNPGDTPPTTGDNADVGDGQGTWNGDRLRQVASLMNFVSGLQSASGSPDVLMFGDFNAYTQEDPMRALYDGGYLDLGHENPTGHHSYVFSGEEGSLDHAVASPSLESKVTGFDIWEINAHEPYPFQYDANAAFYAADQYRASDHNPELVGLDTDAAVEPTGPVDIQLLGINDFHGRIETVPTSPPAAPANNGGAAELAAVVNAQRALNPNTGFVAAGDNIGASTFVSAIDGDNPTLDVLDQMGLNASAVGNHELDKGFVDLRDRVQARADFPYLAANIYEGSTRPFDAYSVQDIGGVQVGYIGVVTEQTPSLVSPGGISTLTFTDPVAEAEAVAAQLKDGDPANGEADLVVLLAHEGADSANAGSVAALEADPVFGRFMDMSNDVDVIMSGHTHIPFAFVATKPNGDPRPVVEAEEYGRKLAKVTLTVDPDTGEVTNPAASLLTIQNVSPVDPAVKAIVDAAKSNAAVLGAQPLGTITADIKRDPNRAVESDAANFIADVQLDATKDPGRGGAQIAFMNPGGVRTDFLFAPDGVITYQEAFAVQSFSNDVVTKTYTGAQIKQVLEEQWQPAGAARPKLGLGVSKGFTFSYNPNGLQGNRVVASSMKLNGARIKLTGTYRVTVNVFLATGGDNFFTLAGGTDRTTTGDNDLQMLIDYFSKYSPVTADTVKRTTAVADTRVQGTVTKVVGGVSQPVAGAQVRLYQAGVPTGSTATTTDAQGRYTFAPTAPGTYQVWFRSSDPLVASEWYHDATSQDTATPVVVTSGPVTVNEVLTYTPPIVKSTITGVVTGPDGTTPLAGIQVRLYPIDGGASAATTTDAQGRYTFANRLQGDYKLWFRVLSPSMPYLSEYHADKASLALADVVTLTASTLTVDASLAARP